MRLIFIRHGEPDYKTDTLTENGKKEAAALAARTRSWDVDAFYCSPLGRARQTAQPTLDALHATATVYPWLQEFYVPKNDPEHVRGQDSRFHLLIYRFSGNTALCDALLPGNYEPLKTSGKL